MNNFKTHFWQLGKISLPLTLATASGTILIFIDSLFATRVSIETYEAIFLTLPIMGLSTGIGVGLSASVADLISKEKELLNIKRLISASVILAALCILVFLYVAIFQTDLIERVAGVHKLSADSLITLEFRNYWKIILWTFPMQIFFALTVQLLTILEKQKAGTAIIIAILIINIFLDYLFTQVFDWGAAGLAYSTMGVFSAGVLLSLIPLRKEPYFQLPYPSILNRLFFQAFSKMTIMTFLIFLTVAIFSVSAMVLNQIALDISTSVLVIFAVYTQIMRVIIITTRGLGGGFIIYFGNALRDKNTEEYYPIYWAATAWIAVAQVTGAVLMFLFPNTLINFFDNVDVALFPDLIYCLAMGAVILIVFILPRMAVIGFISLNRPVFMVLHSIIFVTMHLSLAFYWTQTGDVKGIIQAELVTALVTNLFVLPVFYYYLSKSKKEDALAVIT